MLTPESADFQAAARFCLSPTAPLKAGDALHLAICQRQNSCLVSFDRQLHAAAKRHCVSTQLLQIPEGSAMAQLLVRNLDDSVKEALRRRALCHGRSMEEEARVILSQAAQSADWAPGSSTEGLGTRIAGLFAGLGLDKEISEWPCEEATAADFGA